MILLVLSTIQPPPPVWPNPVYRQHWYRTISLDHRPAVSILYCFVDCCRSISLS
jgi:hypothetical protein